eukprot:Blabericola_migrator_1__10007@NODE_5540_length_737_cov_3_743284_g3594_i0_p1_GENE_NODE_5540_length_737_cov_3_743284_g3594_i0NODE_5540_length_737_cov_3_743284_g3594_i0_p1_ORF_typecomplete_len182_score10_29_NODE_5540_length_737_cov_3_743284_g3594_i018563
MKEPEGTEHEKAQLNDLVVVHLHGSKQQALVRGYGDAKVTPLWSLPRRVVGLSKEGRSVETVSLWDARDRQVSHEDDVRVLPKAILYDQAMAAVREFELDLKGVTLPPKGTEWSRGEQERRVAEELERRTNLWLEATGWHTRKRARVADGGQTRDAAGNASTDLAQNRRGAGEGPQGEREG